MIILCVFSQKGKKQGDNKLGRKTKDSRKSIILVETNESKQINEFKSCRWEINAILRVFYNDLLWLKENSLSRWLLSNQPCTRWNEEIKLNK